MGDIVETYKREKCSKCGNRNKKIEEEKCDVRVFRLNDYKYCKCCNMTDKKKEIKEQII